MGGERAFAESGRWPSRIFGWPTVQKGGALFRYGNRISVADVIFAEEGDSTLLGSTTLASLGLVLDSLRRELRPAPMVL